MRIKAELVSNSKITLPRDFNVYLQAVIYNNIEESSANWLHEQGYLRGKRQFKLFTFSSILEKGQFNHLNKIFTFPQTISFFIASPIDWILQELANHFMKKGYVMLGDNRLPVSSVAVMKNHPVRENKIRVRALTPIEMHSTFTTPENKKKTHYYTPFDNDFSPMLNDNMKRKWQALYQKECPYSISISPKFRGNKNEKIIFFGTGKNKVVVKAWRGNYDLSGDIELLNFALDTGLGGKNSQGFGMIERVNGN